MEWNRLIAEKSHHLNYDLKKFIVLSVERRGMWESKSQKQR